MRPCSRGSTCDRALHSKTAPFYNILTHRVGWIEHSVNQKYKVIQAQAPRAEKWLYADITFPVGIADCNSSEVARRSADLEWTLLPPRNEWLDFALALSEDRIEEPISLALIAGGL